MVGTPKPHLALVCACLGVATAAAEPLEILVITGTAVPTRANGSGAATSVISRPQIELQRPLSVPQLLRQVPGVHVDRSEGRGGVASLYLRGADPNYTLVMIDGVKVNDPTNSRGGSFDFSELDPALIERIEIVSGPMSAVYGSEAMAGAVNIITGPGDVDAASIGAEAGSRGFHAASARMTKSGEAVDFRVAAGHRDYGSSEGGEGQVTSASANFGFKLRDARRFNLGVRSADSRYASFPEDSGGPDHAVLRELEKRDARHTTAHAELTKAPHRGLGYRFLLSRSDRDEKTDSPGVAPGIRDPFGLPASNTATDYRRDEALASVSATTARQTATVGLQHTREIGAMHGILDFGTFTLPTDFALTRTTDAAFAELQHRPSPEWSLVAGIRADRAQGFGTEVSPRVGASYEPAAGGTKWRASAGKGFKLPSFFALAHPLVGNPDLLPEKARSVDAGVTQALYGGRVTVSLDVFRSTYADAIDFDPGPPPRLVNRSSVLARGAQLKAAWVVDSSLEVDAALGHVRTEIEGSGEELRNRPRRTASLGAIWYPAVHRSVNLRATYTGPQLDSSIPTGAQRLPGYTRVDLTYAVEQRPGLRWFVSVSNLLDKSYQEYIGYPTPGIALYTGVDLSI